MTGQQSDGPEERWLAVLENVYKAVRIYGRAEFGAIVAKVIYRLQRLPASGIYGDDYSYKTLWDEYCHEVQEGPFDLPDAVDSSPAAAWAFTIDSLLDDVLDRVPRHAAVLLSIYAAWELDGDDDTELIGTVWPDGMKQVLRSKSAETAGARNLYKFAP